MEEAPEEGQSSRAPPEPAVGPGEATLPDVEIGMSEETPDEEPTEPTGKFWRVG